MAVLRLVALVFVAGLAVAAAPQAADEQVLRTPSMPEWKLLHKVDPEYPSAALQYRIQGTVRFNAVIGKDGHIERLRLISGHPLLVRAAREAARQWIYRPTLLGDKPLRVITHIEVQFQLVPSGNPLKHNNRNPNRTTVL
jgi:protein TonB